MFIFQAFKPSGYVPLHKWKVYVYEKKMVLQIQNKYYAFDRKASPTIAKNVSVFPTSPLEMAALGEQFYYLLPGSGIVDENPASVTDLIALGVLHCLAFDNYFIYNNSKYYYKGNCLGASYRAAVNAIAKSPNTDIKPVKGTGISQVYLEVIKQLQHLLTTYTSFLINDSLPPVPMWDAVYYHQPSPAPTVTYNPENPFANAAEIDLYINKIKEKNSPLVTKSGYLFVINNGKVER